MKNNNDYTEDAHRILISLGLPRAQQNERSALCLLALLNLAPGKAWTQAENPLMGITPIMDWARQHYQKEYAPNTRETVRRQTMHQFVDASIALYNPDNPARPVNSPKAVYQIEPAALTLLRSFGTAAWHDNLTTYLAGQQTLAARYACEREQNRIPVQIAPGKAIALSPGDHSELIRAIIEDFAPRFVPGGVLIYAGDTGDKWGYFDAPLLADLGVDVDSHGKMPDVVLHYLEAQLATLGRVRDQPRPGRRQAPRRAGAVVCRFIRWLGLCDRLSFARTHDALPSRNRLGNRSMGGRRTIPPNSL